MSGRIAELIDSRRIWKHFASISAIPRGSGNEQAVINHIKHFAETLQLTTFLDSIGNLIVKKPGLHPTVILQGHVDIVTEKNNDVKHDFLVDPIQLTTFVDQNQVEWVKAQGTTLGADNGIAVAAMMAILELKDDSLPSLECLFTVEEETGLDGAKNLDPTPLEGNILINLDSEEWGTVTIGCAGGAGIEGHLVLEGTELTGHLVQVDLTGLLGGHSGLEIHENRANAVKKMARFVSDLGDSVRIVHFVSGDKDNAIPREARVVLALLDSELTVSSVESKAQSMLLDEIKANHVGLDADTVGVSVVSVDSGSFAKMLSAEEHGSFLRALLAVPHGALVMSASMEGVTETSSNLAKAVVDLESGSSCVLISARSFHERALDGVLDEIRGALESNLSDLVKVRLLPSYPGWAPAPTAQLCDVVAGAMQRKLKHYRCGASSEKVGVVALHAGLECGILMERIGRKLDMVSYGPTIKGAHSPDERLRVDTVVPFYDMTIEILQELAENDERNNPQTGAGCC